MFLGKQLSWEGNKHEPLNCCACVELTKQCFAFLPGLWTLLDYKNVHCRCHSVKAGNLRTQLKWRKTNLLLSVVFLASLELDFCWQLLSMAMCDTSALWSLLLACCFSRLKRRCWLWPTKPQTALDFPTWFSPSASCDQQRCPRGYIYERAVRVVCH